jgi:hypothetical protein
MTYQLIDEALERWLTDHSVKMYTSDREEQVRSFDVVGPTGKKVQVWIDSPSFDGEVNVHVWDYRRRREDLSGAVADVVSLVDTAYMIARRWLADRQA